MASKIIIGTSGWIYRDWHGAFYPEDLPQTKWLEYYQKYFHVVEINATFYRLFADKTFLQWKNRAKRSFKYIVKVPQMITHRKLLKNCDLLIQKFCQSTELLENKLALILLQLSPRMPYDLPRLEQAIKAFAHPHQVVVEFRHEKWLTEEVHELLTKLGCVFCSADSPIAKLNDWVTSSVAYIRLHGRTRWYDYNYSDAELKEIVQIIKKMEQKGAKRIYVLFNNDYSAFAVENALALDKLVQHKIKQ